MQMKKIFLFFMLLCTAISAQAKIAKEDIPPVLQGWENWVLYDYPAHACPFLYNTQDDRYCAWPTLLNLNVMSDKIYFNQAWQVFTPSIIQLPGEPNLWPQQVQVNGEYYPVFEKNQQPVLELSPGLHHIQGFLPFHGEKPTSIKIPEHTGLVQLAEQNKKINHPRFEAGQLWLTHEENKSFASALQLRVFRKIIQSVPMKVQTLIELDVSGAAREVQLGPVLLPETIAMRVDSALPAQLDENGLLRVQLRPGKWQIEITERFPHNIDTLKRAEVGPPWPAEEIWVFEFDQSLGSMTVSGVPNVDPTQTMLPEAWRHLPAYRVLVADPVLLSATQNTHLFENQLTLTRQMWLDFSGQLWTIEDTLEGQMLSGWRLSLHPPFILGSFSLNNHEQLITLLENTEGERIPGVEVRQGTLNAQASSLLQNIWRMNVTGWNVNFNRVSTTLSLPPGWQLFTAWGVEQLTGSVLETWSLFDIFVVLLIAFAITSILGRKWGLLAFFMLLLTYHQSSYAIFIWLNIVAVLWLIQWFKPHRWIYLLTLYRDLSFACLAVMIVWISAMSLIHSLYPQAVVKPITTTQVQEARPEMMMAQTRQKVAEIEPLEVPVDAKTQMGPAKPQWEWTTVQMDWQTRVAKDQHVYLFLISPLIQRIFTMIQIILLIGVSLRLWRMRSQPLHWTKPLQREVFILPFCVAMGLSIMSPKSFADIPDPDLLETLQNRLLVPDNCLPACASVSSVIVNVNEDEIYLSLQIDASESVAVPIPGRSAYWQADQVLINQMPAAGLFWKDNTLMVQLQKGHHNVTVYGKVGDMDKVSFDFLLNPHWLEVSAPGWFVEGLENQQLSGEELHLIRRERSTQNEATTVIQPFVRVVRHLTLGLTGEVTTRVERISPLAGAIQLQIPLLAHESVNSSGVSVQNNQVQVYFSQQQQEFTWQSTLVDFTDLTLLAPETKSFVEEWQLYISPIWHPTITGVAPSYEAQYAAWQSTWRPWPGESVHIQLSRLPAMPGPTLTIEEVNVLTQAIGRVNELSATALLRSTLGGAHTLKFPQSASIQSVKVNGVTQVLQTGNDVTIPLGPGNNWVDLIWHIPAQTAFFTRTGILDWGMPAYNINLGLNIPKDRWVLALGGAGYGPASLYWLGAAAAIVLAIILGKMSTTKLRTVEWLILLLGLSLVTPLLGLWVVIALVVWSLYSKWIVQVPKPWHRVVQILLGLLFVLAIVILLQGMLHALRDMPNMHIIPSALTSPLSADYVWLQDFSAKIWPRAWIISVPLWVYRGAMLLWSLWVVLTVLRLVLASSSFLSRTAK